MATTKNIPFVSAKTVIHTKNNLVKNSFPVLNLSCASCAVSVERMIKSQHGVVSAAVNYANSTALVEYDASLTDMNLLKTSVQSLGYDIIIAMVQDMDDLGADIQQKKVSQFKFRSIGALLFSFPVVLIGMAFMDMAYANWIMMAFSIPVVFYFGRDFFINAYKQALHKNANMDTLVALSTGVAFTFSMVNTIFPNYQQLLSHHSNVYFESASAVIAFILLGRWLEEIAKSNTSSAIKKLIGLQPKTVTLIPTNGDEIEISLSQVKIGDVILIRPGDKIPVDGALLSGTSYVDESMVSGEPQAVVKVKGNKVFAGTLNQKGSFTLRAEKVGGATLLGQIIKLVQEAQGSKAPIQKLADKIASIFVPIVIVISLCTFTFWAIFGGENGVSHGLFAMVTVLVIACPCALGLATPTAIMVGMGKGAEEGILIKDAESLELSHQVTTVVLDKTGTITEGKPEVEAYSFFEDDEKKSRYLKSVLLAIEHHSAHPLAEAVVRKLKSEGIIAAEISTIKNIPGKGIYLNYNGSEYIVGNEALLREYNVNIPADVSSQAQKWQEDLNTVIIFSEDKNVMAVFAITDKIKSNSKIAVDELKTLGIDVVMLTGDNRQTAKSVAEKANIKNYHAGMLPQDKASFVKRLQDEGEIVAMVGDGINDAQALAQADISIAMGNGSEIALDVARMTIISSDLRKISRAISLSRLTSRVIKQNLFWAFIYNILGIPIAAGVLYPFFGVMLSPMIAGAAMAFSSVSVVTNSLRIRLTN